MYALNNIKLDLEDKYRVWGYILHHSRLPDFFFFGEECHIFKFP
jgi:hypothetical protein